MMQAMTIIIVTEQTGNFKDKNQYLMNNCETLYYQSVCYHDAVQFPRHCNLQNFMAGALGLLFVITMA
jgi:hypothetical protein